MTKKITNRYYRQFLDDGEIDIVPYDTFKAILKDVDGIRGNYKIEARCLMIVLYYTGARPVEIFSIAGRHIEKDGNQIVIKIRGAKRGKPRKIYLSYNRAPIKYLYKYSQRMPPDVKLFYHFSKTYLRRYKTKAGLTKYRKEEICNRLYYHVKRWTKAYYPPDGLPPYYFRHSRFSQLSEAGATMQDLANIKGARTINSVEAYLHMSKNTAQKIGRKIK